MSRPLTLVTSIGPGAGGAISRRLSAGGYDVAMPARNAERLAALANEVPTTMAYA
jgi:NADP-dependent 3-hydroxy acid dehydrogenase YdfG